MSATDEDDDALAPPQHSPGSNVSSVHTPHRRGVAGAGAGGYPYAVNFGRADFLGPQSESGNSAYDAEPTDQELFGGGGEPPDRNMAQECHVSRYDDFDESFLAGLSARPPAFYQLPGHGWSSYKELYTPDQDGDLTSFLPVRSMVFNLPIELWSSDAARFVDWATPKVGASRAANLAALIGLIYTPLSKGWLSGEHEEKKRAEGESGSADGASRTGDKHMPKRVFRYMYVDGGNVNVSHPMFVIGLERVYKQDRKTVCALRVWHHIFDESHSTSGLMRKLMDETQDSLAQQGLAHAPNSLRRGNIVADGRKSRVLADGFHAQDVRLELFAGTQYLRITNEAQWLNILGSCCGKTDTSDGRHFIEDFESKLPSGAFNYRLAEHKRCGSVHPASPEWLCNAKRDEALKAGLVHLDGTPMNEDPAQVDPNSYFSEDGTFKVPLWVADAEAYHLMTDPNIVNIFDAALPYQVKSADKPGPHLQELFRDLHAPSMEVDSNELLDAITNKMTGRDQTTVRMLRAFTESIAGFDSIEMTEDERRTLRMATLNGVRSYGRMDDDADVIEPTQKLVDISHESTLLHREVVEPWAHSERRRIDDMFSDVTDKSPATAHKRVLEAKQAFQQRHNAIMKDVAVLHLSRMDTAFNSKADRATIPAGWRAVYDGLMEELKHMPNNTANIAHVFDMQMMDSDRTVFASISDWICNIFECDAFIEGRDWRVMQELWLHTLEPFSPQTLILLLCGPKGNGKTLRTERMQKLYVPGWVSMSGPSSAKAGMQGNSDSFNGTCCMYDEMIDELLGNGGSGKDGDNRLEYWKQIVLNRYYVYSKALPVRRADGLETHRTVKLCTPHNETHCILTNRGPAFTKGTEDPSEVKAAMIDRSCGMFVRTLGAKTHSNAEFEAHLQNEDVKKRIRAFRIFTCLVALVRMFIYRNPAFAPDMALAQKMWDEWDSGEFGLDQGYGLPKPSPRKNMKRTENCISMTIAKAVAETFFYKNTAHAFECSQMDEEGEPKPFNMKMLWEVVQLLQPTQEIIHMAWSFGLNYNIGTSEMGLNAMTIVAEQFGMKIDDIMRTPVEEDDLESKTMHDSDLMDMDTQFRAEHAKAEAARAAAAGGGGGGDGGDGAAAINNTKSSTRLRVSSQHASVVNAEFERIIQPGRAAQDDLVRQKLQQLTNKRQALHRFRHHCVRDSHCSRKLDSIKKMVDGVIEGGELVLDGDEEGDVDDAFHASPGGEVFTETYLEDAKERMSADDYGKLLFQVFDACPEGPRRSDMWGRTSVSSKSVQQAFLHAYASKYPGKHNCISANSSDHDQFNCPFCGPELRGEIGSGAGAGSSTDPMEVGGTDALDEVNPDPEVWQSLACSRLLPDAIDATLFYKSQSLMQWATNKPAVVDFDDRSDECAVLGSKRIASVSRRRKESGPGGGDVFDTAWLQLSGKNFDTWFRFARYVKERKNSTISNALDVHVDGLRDLFYLLSTGDNRRRCSEQPWVAASRSQEHAFVDCHGMAVTSKSTVIKVRGTVSDAPPRCPESGMRDSKLDRAVMGLFMEGKLPALDFYASNNIVMSPPIRMHDSGIEANVSALHAHITLCAEASLRCSQIPGLRNQQEKFSHNSPGPEGTTSAEAVTGSSRKRSVNSESEIPVFIDPLRPEISRLWSRIVPKPDQEWIQVCMDVYHEISNPLKEIFMDTVKKAAQAHHTLPFSYDHISISISATMAEMIYDDYSYNQVRSFNQTGILLETLVPSNLPHLSMRYVGFSEKCRQTISVPLNTKRSIEFSYVEAGDPSEIESGITAQHVDRILCRSATAADVRSFISGRQGAMSMRGVTGDLFATSTWVKHALTSLTERGIIVDDSNAARVLANANSCANARMAEAACVKKLPGFAHLRLVKAKPGSYQSIEENAMEVAIAQRQCLEKNKRRPSAFVHQSLDQLQTLDPKFAAIAPQQQQGREEMEL